MHERCLSKPRRDAMRCDAVEGDMNALGMDHELAV